MKNILKGIGFLIFCVFFWFGVIFLLNYIDETRPKDAYVILTGVFDEENILKVSNINIYNYSSKYHEQVQYIYKQGTFKNKELLTCKQDIEEDCICKCYLFFRKYKDNYFNYILYNCRNIYQVKKINEIHN